jgi:hypothetical protein
MQSDAIDELISTYLAMPARVSWKGAIGDSVRGTFVGGRLELAGVAVLALPCQRLVLESERFQFTPGLPARIQAIGPRVEMTIEQPRGWFVLRPRRATFLGLENRLATLFRTFFPMPRLAPETRLTGIRHGEGALVLEFTLADFEEELRPGLAQRLQQRFLPLPRLGFSGRA